MQIVASVDDCSSWDLQLAELFDKHNIPTIFFWPLNRIDTSYTLTLDECQSIAKRFEIGSHTLTHALLTRIPIDEAEREIRLSKLALEGIFGQEIKSFCYPRGYGNDRLIEAVRKSGYTYARNTSVGFAGEPKEPLWSNTAVHLGYQRKEYNGIYWPEYARKLWEINKDKEGVFHIWMHGEELNKVQDGFKEVEKLLEDISS